MDLKGDYLNLRIKALKFYYYIRFYINAFIMDISEDYKRVKITWEVEVRTGSEVKMSINRELIQFDTMIRK